MRLTAAVGEWEGGRACYEALVSIACACHFIFILVIVGLQMETARPVLPDLPIGYISAFLQGDRKCPAEVHAEMVALMGNSWESAYTGNHNY
jgi:hypothetical protein